MSNTTSSCITLTWSAEMVASLGSTFYICITAVVIHSVFWVQLVAYSSVRQKGMMWLYAYLITDILLLFRFLFLYGTRQTGFCVPTSSRTMMCYFEATFKFYLNIVQSYLLLALNVSRYVQIVFNRNVYMKHPRLIILAHLFIYTMPLLNIILQFVASWMQLWRMKGSLCDVQYASLGVEFFNLVVIYVIPVSLNLIFLSLCIRHISLTTDIRSQQIINNRRKRHRTLLTQSIAFYSIWLALWSPYILSFPFINVNSTVGTATSTLNYLQAALDPVVVTALDVRFLKAWQMTWHRIRGHRQGRIMPFVASTTVQRY